ncbi:MAG: cell envelope biosis protein TolA [Sphingomonas bacterium]|nr:cell envelope biosis protein TolA [Sphingomonas bacterium]
MMPPGRQSVKQDRGIEFAVSAVLHIVVFAGLSMVLLVPRAPPPPPAPMDVTIADDVGLQAAAPQSLTPPAQSQAPDLGKPEDAAPAAPAPEAAEPAPPKPQPAAAPPPKPAEIAKPQPKKIAPPAPQAAKAPARPAPSSALAKIVGRGSGVTPGATANRPRGPALGGVMSGLGTIPNNSKSITPQATMTGAARASINGKIAEQIQPCALNHKLPPTPGIDRVRVIVRLSFARDGNLSAPPQIVRIEGLNDDTERYADLVRRSALATFSDRACLPIRGLPADLYDVPGGWRSVPLGFRLPG